MLILRSSGRRSSASGLVVRLSARNEGLDRHAQASRGGTSCNSLLQQDLSRFLAGVLRLCAVDPLGPRHLALTSFAFNVGLGNLQNSTLRMKHNREDYSGAADEFLKWNLSAGKVLAGLDVRRKDERALYLGAVNG